MPSCLPYSLLNSPTAQRCSFTSTCLRPGRFDFAYHFFIVSLHLHIKFKRLNCIFSVHKFFYFVNTLNGKISRQHRTNEVPFTGIISPDILQFPRKSIRVIAKGSAVLPSRKSVEPFSSHKVIFQHPQAIRAIRHVRIKRTLRLLSFCYQTGSQVLKKRVFSRFCSPSHPLFRHSHSILAGGLVVTSSTTRFTCGTSFTILAEIVRTTSYGMRAQSAVMKSSVVTARMATV